MVRVGDSVDGGRMNREIKFRVWSDLTKRMVSDVSLLQDVVDKSVRGSVLSLRPRTDGHHVMQFTGLVDKHGVEIYEGDILKYAFDDAAYEPEDYEDGLPYVMFDFGCFRYRYNHWEAEGLTGLPLGDSTSYMVVVGNVHENPELLESSQNVSTTLTGTQD